ncbi:hypothetical protein T12_8253 [Trichinella patagoniensis]|uniref:Uncharacterized protein n=1 Tax=Trichinella patagoniensis TaxID=990121 RepID=A0A0V1A6W4_9BILA|nr:hypothetical protein T12_8253 [Trichinella patagoniensis]
MKSVDSRQLFQSFQCSILCGSKVRWMSGWSLHSFCSMVPGK